MLNNGIDNKIISMIAEQLHMNAQEITAQSTLTNLGADSLDRVELIMKCEEEFSIEIHDADAEKFVTVGDIISYIQSRTS